MVKFKVYRLREIPEIEPALNDFDLGEILDYSITAPDYRIIILVVRYGVPAEEAKDDKPTK